MSSAAAELVARSNRLGSDPKNTNYAGGNTSAKGAETDPVTGEDVELLWVKGSGGDLGTLTEGGLAVLRLDRMRALVDVYPGVEREDEMVAAFDYCLHGKGGAAPSIDTAMHGLVDAPHVDHLHPDSGIAIATAVDGEALTQRDLRRQGGLGAVAPARLPARPRHRRDQGGEPEGDRLHPRWPRHHRLGRHLRGVRAQLAVDDPHRRALHQEALQAEPVRRAARRSSSRWLPHERRARAAELAPLLRGVASQDRPMVGHFTDDAVGARLPGLAEPPAAGRARHQLPRPLPAHQGQADGARPAAGRAAGEGRRRAVAELHAAYRADYQAYYERNATRTRRRSAAPTR